MKPCIQLSEIPREPWHLNASLWNFRKRRKEGKPCKYSYIIHKRGLVQMLRKWRLLNHREQNVSTHTLVRILLFNLWKSSFAAPAGQQDLEDSHGKKWHKYFRQHRNKSTNKHQVYESHSRTIMPLKIHSLGIHFKIFDGSMPSAGWNSLVTEQSNTSRCSAIKGPAEQT